MRSDDDTFLSAYLDGELDCDQQQLVDSALVSSPDLAERLRALSVVREFVAGLPREPGVDVAPLVMSRIRRQRGPGRMMGRIRRLAPQARYAAAVAGIMTVAAGMLLTVTLAAYLQSRGHDLAPGPRGALDNVIADTSSTVPVDAREDVSPLIALRPTAPASPSSVAPYHTAAIDKARVAANHNPEKGEGDQPAAADLEVSRRFLESPYRRRLFLSKSGGEGAAVDQVISAVERTTRFGFLKITVAQGIVIDPRHPGEATVFALLVKPNELDRLAGQLKEALPDLVEEPSADPAIVTQLADIGRVRSLSPAALGDVLVSRDDLALRTRIAGTADGGDQSATAGAEKVSSLPTAEQFRSAPLPTVARSGSAVELEHGAGQGSGENVARNSPAGTGDPSMRIDPGSRIPAMAKSDETMLVFVWICKPRAS